MNYIWKLNKLIHSTESLTPKDFLSEIKQVKKFRVRDDLCFSFFPYGKEDYELNLQLYEYFNGKPNLINDKYLKVFSIYVPENLELFLKHTEKGKIKKAITLSIAQV